MINSISREDMDHTVLQIFLLRSLYFSSLNLNMDREIHIKVVAYNAFCDRNYAYVSFSDIQRMGACTMSSHLGQAWFYNF